MTKQALKTGTIYQQASGDYTHQIHYAMNADGVWFNRYQQRTPWGYSWTKWKRGFSPDESRPVAEQKKKPRLPA